MKWILKILRPIQKTIRYYRTDVDVMENIILKEMTLTTM